MQKNTNEDDSYMIPTNVATRFELTSGIGLKEIGYMIIAIIIGIIASLIIGLQTVPVERKVYVENDKIDNEVFQTKTGRYETVIEQESVISPSQRILFVILPAGIVFMMLKKNTSGQSAADMLKSYYKYQRGQKRYELKGVYYHDKIEAEAAKQKNGNNPKNGDS